jgi:hypothetical protein
MILDKQTIKDALFAGKTVIGFTKANGEKREMLCTLRPDLIPAEPIIEGAEPKAPRKENPDVQAVWDLEKQAWRSFRFDSVLFILENVE